MSKRRRNNHRKRRSWHVQPFVPNQASVLRYPLELTKQLQCSNEFWSATATWRRHEGIWSCSYADPVLQWMIGLDQDSAKMELLRRGCSWEWSETKPESVPSNTKQAVAEPPLDLASKAQSPLESDPVLSTRSQATPVLHQSASPTPAQSILTPTLNSPGA